MSRLSQRKVNITWNPKQIKIREVLVREDSCFAGTFDSGTTGEVWKFEVGVQTGVFELWNEDRVLRN